MHWALFAGLFSHLLLTVRLVPVVHTVVILVQTVTLNVAVNSHSKALLTIMVSNNFVELKGSVFKKFERNNLFQMSCSGKTSCCALCLGSSSLRLFTCTLRIAGPTVQYSKARLGYQAA